MSHLLSTGVNHHLLDADFDVIMTSLEYACTSQHFISSTEECAKFADVVITLSTYLNMRGYYGRGEQILRCAIELCKFWSVQYKLSHLHYHAAAMKMSSGRYKDSIIDFNIVEEMAAANNQDEIRVNALFQLGTVYINLGDYQKGEEYYHRSLKRAEDIGLPSAVCLSTHLIGTSKIKQLYFADALTWLHKSEQIIPYIQEDPNIARIQISIWTFTALAHLGLGSYRIAQGYCEQARKLASLITEKNWVSNLDLILGTLELIDGNPKDAEERIVHSLKTFRDINNEQGQMVALSRFASVKLYQGNIDECKLALNQGVRIATDLSLRDWNGVFLFYFGVVNLICGQHDVAIFYLEKSLLIFREINHLKAVAVVEDYILKSRDAANNFSTDHILELTGITLF